MKTTGTTITAIAALVALGLAGCSYTRTVDPGSTVGSAEDCATLASISYQVDDAGIPQLAFDFPLSLTSSAARVVSEGTGAEIPMDDTITLDYTVTSGTDGSLIYSTYDTGNPEYLAMSESTVDSVLLEILVGHHVGSTVIFGTVDATAADGATDFLAITVSATTTPLARAEGAAVAPVEGLPVVTLADNGAPSIVFPATEPPIDLVSQTLIEGAGPVVTEGSAITAHYTGWLWDGAVFSSSWISGTPEIVMLGPYDSDGWVEGLVGKTVGSQVLLLVPGESAWDEYMGLPATPAVPARVFVVDILAVY